MARKKKSYHYASIILIVISLFCLVSIVSYAFSWRADQDQIIQFDDLRAYLSSDAVAQNLGGRLGAVLAHLLVHESLGIYSLLLVLYTLRYSVLRYTGQKTQYFSSFFYSLLVFILIACPLTSYFTPDLGFAWGGGYGKAMAGLLTKFLGPWGSGILLIGALIMFLYSFDIKILSSVRLPKIPIPSVDFRGFIQKIKEPTFAALANTGAAVMPDEELQTEAEYTTNNEPQLIEKEPSEVSADDIPEWIKIAANEEPDSPTKTSSDLALEPVSPDVAAPNDPAPPPPQAKPQNLKTQVVGIHLENPTETQNPSTTQDINIEAPQEDELEIVIPPEEETIDQETADTLSSNENPNLPYDPKADLSRYKYPKLDLLEEYKSGQVALDKEAIRANIDMITDTLENFNINIDKQRTTATVGPTVTLYEIVPAKGVRISKIRNLEDDIALALAALGIRIIAPIPGRGTIGIEVPNENRQMVGLRSILSSEKFAQSKHQLPLALGKRIDNQNVVIDLAAMPHLLVAGATGQGKSVGINTILISILYKLHPSQVKFVLIDPKKVELSVYRLIEKHFLAKLPDEEESIITDTKKVVNTLNSLCIEMDHRYDLLKSAGARNLKEYNAKFVNRKLNPKVGHKFLPLIVLVIDEFADLIMTAGKEVENPIARLAQLARAVGIHLIVATQRPDTKVITGTIKANFPARIAFKVSSQFDSRTILDSKGAEQLIGKGDMLLSAGGEVSRIQCAFVDTHEVERIVEYIGQQQGYPDVFELPEYVPENEDYQGPSEDDLQKRDKLFEDCARMVVSTDKGSTSMLQRKFNLGYNRAGRIMDQLEAAGIVGPSTGGKAREVYIKSDFELDEILNNLP